MVATLTRPSGLTIIRPDRWIPDELKWRMKDWQPKSRMGEIIKDCLKFLPPELAGELVERITSCVVLESSLRIEVTRSPLSHDHGPWYEDRGIVSRKKVTTQGVTALCAAWGSAAFSAIYMALATTNTAEANTDTVANRFDTGSEIAANHYTGSARPTCTHVESTNTVPIVGVHTHATADDTVEAHGICDSATRSAGNLWDRSLTGTTVLHAADTLTGTYTLTASAEA